MSFAWLTVNPGFTAADEILITNLRKQKIKLSIVVNKADRYQEAEMASEFYKFGIDSLYVIASKTGRGINALLEGILPETSTCQRDENLISTHDNENLILAHNDDSPISTHSNENQTSTHSNANLISTHNDDNPTHSDENLTSTHSGSQTSESQASQHPDSPTPPTENTSPNGRAAADNEIKQNLINPTPSRPITIAMLGRPNVGKSTLINSMLGEERVMVCDAPGTTRDSISIPLQRGEQKYTLIDTAGIRRRGHSHPTIEKFSVIKSIQAIQHADVTIAVLDANDGVQEQDMRLLQQAMLNGSALVIVYNKWDKLDESSRQNFKQQVDRRLGFTNFARRYHISALHGSGLGEMYRAIGEAYRGLQQDFSTAHLTQILEQAILSHQPPQIKGRRIRLRYAHLVERKPLTIMIHGKQIPRLPQSYQRYLIGFFRKKLQLTGAILHITLKNDNNPYVDEK